MDKITLAGRILDTLNKTVFCNGVFYFYNKKHYAELTDFDLQKIIRQYFVKNKMTDAWTRNASNDIMTAIKIDIASKNEVEFMDNYDCYIPIENGVVDFTDMNKIKLIKHSDDLFFTYVVPVEWDPRKHYDNPTKFLAFLNDIFRNKDGSENEDLVNTVLYIMGYTIYPAIMMEKLFMFLGGGSNGKSMLLKVLSMFFHPDQVTNGSLQSLSDDASNNRDFLLKSRLNIAGEQKGIKIDPEEIKKIASGQALQLVIRYKGNITFEPKTKLFVDSNNLPFFADNTHGTKRRLCIVNFENQFLEDDDYKMQQKVLCSSKDPGEIKQFDLAPYGIYRQKNPKILLNEIRGELNEIFNLLVLYIHKLKDRDWQIPKNEAIETAMRKYEEGTDFVKFWLLDNYQVSSDPKKVTSLNDMYSKFQDDHYTEFGKESLFKKNTLTKRVSEIFKVEGVRVNAVDNRGQRFKDRVFDIEPKFVEEEFLSDPNEQPPIKF